MKKALLALFFLLFVSFNAKAADNTYGEPAQDDAAPAVVNSSSVGVDNAKIDQILQGQSEILKRLEEIQQELQIVKVRATQNS